MWIGIAEMDDPLLDQIDWKKVAAGRVVWPERAVPCWEGTFYWDYCEDVDAKWHPFSGIEVTAYGYRSVWNYPHWLPEWKEGAR